MNSEGGRWKVPQNGMAPGALIKSGEGRSKKKDERRITTKIAVKRFENIETHGG